MPILVSLVGLLIVGLSFVGVASPLTLTGIATRLRAPERHWVAVAVRLVLGLLFLVAGPESRFPLVVQIVGVFALVAAGSLVLLGPKGLESFVGWWLKQPPAFIRAWCLATTAFGGLIVYAGAEALPCSPR